MRERWRLLVVSVALLASPPVAAQDATLVAPAPIPPAPAEPSPPPAVARPKPPRVALRPEPPPPANDRIRPAPAGAGVTRAPPQSNAPQAEAAGRAARTQRLRLSPGCQGLPASTPRDVFHVSALCERSNAGDAQASYELGRMYESGDGVPQDSALALSFLRLAEQQGHGGAREQIGAVEAGRAPVAPMGRAPGSRQAIAAKPLAEAECRRFPVYEPRFIFRLRELCERAQAGNAEAYFALGSLIDAGQQMPRNEALAIRMFQMAAQRGYHPARLRLASMGF